MIDPLFFEGNKTQARDALEKLERRGSLQIVKRALQGGFSYYQLTAQGCGEVGVSLGASKAVRSMGLARALGILWFATQNSAHRARLPADTLPEGFPLISGRQAHVGELFAKDQGRIYRVYVVGEDKDHATALREIRGTIDELTATPEGRSLLQDGVYRFAILVHEKEKKTRFEEALSAVSGSVPAGTVITVETVPSPGNFSLFVKRETE